MILMNYFDFTNHDIPHYKLLAISSLTIFSKLIVNLTNTLLYRLYVCNKLFDTKSKHRVQFLLLM